MIDQRARLQELQRDLGRELETLPSGTVDNAYKALTLFDAMASLLYRLRGQGGAGLSRAEEYVAEASQRIIALGMPAQEGAYAEWLNRYRLIWRANVGLFLMCALVLLAMGMIGWSLGTARPDLVPVILPQSNMENVLAGRAWFEDLNSSPLMGGFAIAQNNIRVGIMAFTGGALFGLGGVASLVFNGVMIGTMLGFCHANDFDGPLVEFMVSHGFLELSIIVAAAFAGLLYGGVFWRFPYGTAKTFGARFTRAGRDAGVVLMGILPWLVLAGACESFISPRPDIDPAIKLLVGASIGTLFWVWTFGPVKR